MRQVITKTTAVEFVRRDGKVREGVWCSLACGHHVVGEYHSRRAYTHANCPWCDAERRDGFKYVSRFRVSRHQCDLDDPDYLPDLSQPIHPDGGDSPSRQPVAEQAEADYSAPGSRNERLS